MRTRLRSVMGGVGGWSAGVILAAAWAGPGVGHRFFSTGAANARVASNPWHTPPDRPAVAVIDFRPEGMLERFEPTCGAGVADALRAHMSPTAYDVLDRAAVIGRLKRCNLTMSDLWADHEEVYRFGQTTAVRYVVVGRVVKRGSSWHLFARLADCVKRSLGPEREVEVPVQELPAEKMAALVTALGMEVAAPPAGDAGDTTPTAALPRMRVVRAEAVQACRLYTHAGGTGFSPAAPGVEITVALNAAELAGRKLTAQERAFLNHAQIGDSVVSINHTDFRLTNPAGEARSAPGNWYVGYAPATRVPDIYLTGHRLVDGWPRVAWKCTSLTTRDYYYDSARPEVIVSVVFPEVGPKGTATIAYRDWPALEVGPVSAPEGRPPIVTVPVDATRLVSVREVQASGIFRRSEGWVVSPPTSAVEVTVVLKTRYMEPYEIPEDQQRSMVPPPAGGWATLVDPAYLRIRTTAGRIEGAAANWFTGLTPGARLENPIQRGTDDGRTRWVTNSKFERTYYFPAADSEVTVTVLYPRLTAADIEAVRFKDWTPVRAQ